MLCIEMKIHYPILFFLFLLMQLNIDAQDSLSDNKSFILLKPTGDFDQRFSYINNELVSIWGYRIGVLVKDKFKTGIGGYIVNHNFDQQKFIAGKGWLFQQNTNLSFGTIYFEPFLIRKKYWESSLVFELGYGKASTDSMYGDIESHTTVKSSHSIVPVGIGFSMNFIMPEINHLHFLTYLGINTMIGLRKTFSKDNYDSWYWSIGSAIFIDKIYFDCKKKNKSRITPSL